MAVAFETFVKLSGDFGGGSGNISVTVPTGLTTNDTWIAWGCDDNNGADGNISAPTGFTAIDAGHRTGGGFPFQRGFWKTAGASEAAVNLPYGSGTYQCTTFSVRLSGADTTNPIGNISLSTGSASATTIAVAAVTIQNNGSLALSEAAGYRTASAVTLTAPATMTRISYENGAGFYEHCGIGYELVNAGSYSPGNWTYSAANQNRTCVTVEILPAAGAGGAVSVDPGAGAVSLTGGTPTEAKALTPQSRALTLTGGIATYSGSLSLSPTGTGISLTGGVPAFAKALGPSTGAITLSGGTPTFSGALALTPGATGISLVAGTATLSTTSQSEITPVKGTLTLAGGRPTFSGTLGLTPVKGTLSLIAGAASLAEALQPLAGTITLQGGTPGLTEAGAGSVTPSAGTLTLIAGTPSVTVVTPVTGSGGGGGGFPADQTINRIRRLSELDEKRVEAPEPADAPPPVPGVLEEAAEPIFGPVVPPIDREALDAVQRRLAAAEVALKGLEAVNAAKAAAKRQADEDDEDTFLLMAG